MKAERQERSQELVSPIVAEGSTTREGEEEGGEVREEERFEDENEAGNQEEQGQEEMPARADNGLSQEVVAVR